MKIPKKIFPDRIVDAIVELKYTLNHPYEVALGMLYTHIDDTYNYSSRPINNPKNSIQQPNSFVGDKVEIQLGIKPIFFNEKIKIELTPGSIIFNCLNEYISWQSYSEEIEKFLNQIDKANVVNSYNRIGIRYISHYPDFKIFDITKFEFTFGMPELKSDTFSFHSEYKLDNYRVILNLNNLVSLFRANHNGEIINTPTSIIDIDVIIEGFEEFEIIKLLKEIDEAHNKQKEIFFSLLSVSYLSSLKPEY